MHFFEVEKVNGVYEPIADTALSTYHIYIKQ